MSSLSSDNAGDDAWLMKIEMKKEELGEINKGDKIKKAAGDQVPAAEEEDILQPYYNHLTPIEIEAFKMIEIVCVQNKYLTRENILLQEHITALKGIIRKLEHLLRSMLGTTSSTTPSSPPRRKRSKYIGMCTPLGNFKLGGVPRYRITITPLSLSFFLVISFWLYIDLVE